MYSICIVNQSEKIVRSPNSSKNHHAIAKSVLQAAAWTYVATAVYAVLQLAQLILISRR
ncbi:MULTISPECIES: zinc metallopeptidase [Spirulina sp. CCY15215]|uniref:zinc metallopeptidase n=1 Tax=Spirulina sp. CCY15215 TaxID=2767591 RepID=UPI0032B003AD